MLEDIIDKNFKPWNFKWIIPKMKKEYCLLLEHASPCLKLFELRTKDDMFDLYYSFVFC